MKIGFWSGLATLCVLFPSPSVQAQLTENRVLTLCVDAVSGRDPIKGNSGPGWNCPDGGTAYAIPYKNNLEHDLQSSATNGTIRKVVIGVHGSGGNTGPLFRGITPNVPDVPPVPTGEEYIWVITPEFRSLDPTETSVGSGVFECKRKSSQDPEPLANQLTWAEENDKGYASGSNSVCPTMPNKVPVVQVSTYDVMDRIILQVKDRAPNVKEIILVGFSGGGRFVNHYSLGSNIENHANIRGNGIRFRYLISSPGSYLYLNHKRYDSNEVSPPTKVVDDPQDNSKCTGAPEGTYDLYPYGISNIDSDSLDEHYMKQPSRDAAIELFTERARSRQRLYMVGELDAWTEIDSDTCGEKAQGADRRHRIFNYMHHLRDIGAATNAGFCVIKNLYHEGKPIAGTQAVTSFWKEGLVNCPLNDDCAKVSDTEKKCVQARRRR